MRRFYCTLFIWELPDTPENPSTVQLSTHNPEGILVMRSDRTAADIYPTEFFCSWEQHTFRERAAQPGSGEYGLRRPGSISPK